MKKIIFTFFCCIAFSISNAQSNKDIANVYLKRARAVLEESINFKEALVQFNKAMQYMDTITSPKIAKFGAEINYEVQNLEDAKKYATQYFLLEKITGTEEYLTFLNLKITIDEELEEKIAEEKRIEEERIKKEEERIKKEKELKKIDSLKTIWNNKSASLSLKVDSIYSFNKNNSALFKAKNYYGIINDSGKILVKADEYQDALSFDGFFILKNKKQEPTKIYCYNSNDKTGFLLPSFSVFNTLSTHYGQVMLPRGNGRLVTYPNNSYEPMVFDLAVKKSVKVANKKELFKKLKKNNVIDKYNKDDQLKIKKVWYNFGGHLGGGIHPLYLSNNYEINSFLCSVDGNVLSATSNYQHIGSFYNNKFQALKDKKTVWINQNGTKVSEPKDESGVYAGDIKVVKLPNGTYQFMKEGFIILENEKLGKMADFLRDNK